jgi:hypothetical protein
MSTTTIVRTALAMYDALKDGSHLLPDEMRDAISNNGGDPAYLQSAATWLRDHGVPVNAIKARQWSEWFIATTANEHNAYQQRALTESFHWHVSIARASAGIHGTGSRTARDKHVKSAIDMGGHLGLTVEEIVDLCKPLPGMTRLTTAP